MDNSLRYLHRVFVVTFLSILSLGMSTGAQAQEHSVAHQWNEVLLDAIRNDFARPTVHARNLWHTSVLMYDCWAVYDDEAQPYFLGKTVGDFECIFEGVPFPDDVQAAQEEAMSYAMYRLILHRFQNAPGVAEIYFELNQKMAELGYDTDITSTDYLDGTPAHLGNYLAEQMIEFGYQDGANELAGYGNTYYETINEPLDMGASGNPDMLDPNRWQPLVVEGAIDQAGNPINPIVDFLSPEWGDVVSFSLTNDDLTVHERDGNFWNVWMDPGAPPYLEEGLGEGLESNWKWGHIMVLIWQSHHDVNDETMIDASPNGFGNNPALPETFDDFDTFYNFYEGGDQSQGYDVNPVTGEPYEPQMVKRADYARVLAEFWADGPDSETPPGHWFTILNTVNEHPLLNKRWNGQGPVLDDLQWDVKTYFVLGSALHDAAIAAWSIKGYYDYSRPVSAIRFMAEKGQCTDPLLPHYHPDGFPLIPGYIELVEEGDPLAGAMNENVGEIKAYTWRGPDYIEFDDEGLGLTEAGVGWILAKDWWPYQRPTFVTPPFAGYISGHSTYSRTAAEVMTLMTGSPFFPGGMSDFFAAQNEFLHFEEGPSADVDLQWATYQDASDQCSISRIYGGIHPPADDIPGRKIGIVLGPQVYEAAIPYFSSNTPKVSSVVSSDDVVNDSDAGSQLTITVTFDRAMDMMSVPNINFPFDDPLGTTLAQTSAEWIDANNYQITYDVADVNENFSSIYYQISGANDIDGFLQTPYIEDFLFIIDTRNPAVDSTTGWALVNDASANAGSIEVMVDFDEAMDTDTDPVIFFPNEDPLSTLIYNAGNSYWDNDQSFVAAFDVADVNEEIAMVDIGIQGAIDAAGNELIDFFMNDVFDIDTRNPMNTDLTPDAAIITDALALGVFTIEAIFDEAMDQSSMPSLVFSQDDPMMNSLVLNGDDSGWQSADTYLFSFDVNDGNETLSNINIEMVSALDLAGNEVAISSFDQAFSIDTENPSLQDVSLNDDLLADVNVGNATVQITIDFNEMMDAASMPVITFSEDLSASLTGPTAASDWLDADTYVAVYDLADAGVEIDGVGIEVTGTADMNGNAQIAMTMDDLLSIDTRNPEPLLVNANDYELTFGDAGDGNFSIVVIFDEEMNTNIDPFVLFPAENPLSTLTLSDASDWLNSSTFEAVYDVSDATNLLLDIDVVVTGAVDLAGNLLVQSTYEDFFDIDINPVGVSELSDAGVKVFPNPVSNGNVLNISMENPEMIDRLAVYNVSGQLVTAFEKPAIDGQSRITLPTADMAPGMYMLNIYNQNGVNVMRFQILR